MRGLASALWSPDSPTLSNAGGVFLCVRKEMMGNRSLGCTCNVPPWNMHFIACGTRVDKLASARVWLCSRYVHVCWSACPVIDKNGLLRHDRCSRGKGRLRHNPLQLNFVCCFGKSCLNHNIQDEYAMPKLSMNVSRLLKHPAQMQTTLPTVPRMCMAPWRSSLAPPRSKAKRLAPLLIGFMMTQKRPL